MPLVRIEVREGRSRSEKQALFDAVHEALVEAFRIPDDDRTQRLIELPAADLEIDPSHGDLFTLVEITAFPGRSTEAKAHLFAAITRNLAAAGVPEDDVLIVVLEPPLENWGIRGGRSAADVDLGFDTQV